MIYPRNSATEYASLSRRRWLNKGLASSIFAPDKQIWPIFVVSLHDARCRRREIAHQLQELDLSFEISDATDGRSGLTRAQEKLIDRPGTLAALGRRMTDAEYACAISHLRIWQRIVEQKLPGAIILEDDAILDRPFADFLNSKGYEAAPLVLLDHEKALAWKWTRPVRKRQGVQLLRIVGNADRTTGYTLSSRGAAFLVANSLPLQRPADWPCDITPLKPLAVLPRLVDRPEDRSDSTIEKSRSLEFATKPRIAKTRKNRILRRFRSSWWRKKFLKRFAYRIS